MNKKPELVTYQGRAEPRPDRGLKRCCAAAAIIATIILATPVGAVTISHDNGGSVRERHEEIVAHVGEVRIDGPCNSACTMWLAHDSVCVTEKAVLGFHAPFNRKMDDETLDDWRVAIASHYPKKIQEWYLSGAGHKRKLSKISGSELMRLGVKGCE